MAFVGVRDTAEAILLAYENPKTEGRCICSAYKMSNQALVEKLKSIYPDLDCPKSFKEVMADLRLSSIKLQNLGWKYRLFEKTLVNAVENYKQTGALGGNITNGNKSG